MVGLGISGWIQLRASGISLQFIFKRAQKRLERSAFCRYRPRLYSVSYHSVCWHSSLSSLFFNLPCFPSVSVEKLYTFCLAFPISSASESNALWNRWDTRNPSAEVKGHLTSVLSVPNSNGWLEITRTHAYRLTNRGKFYCAEVAQETSYVSYVPRILTAIAVFPKIHAKRKNKIDI